MPWRGLSIPGELRRPGLSLLLQEERVRGVQRAGHRDGARRPPRARHLQLDQDCGHKEEEEKQQPSGQGTIEWRELEFSYPPLSQYVFVVFPMTVLMSICQCSYD